MATGPATTSAGGYAAFISYSHRDSRLVRRLQHFLETWRLPRGLRADGARRLGRVFVDETELTAGRLAARIREAISASDALVVVCSPAAAASPWVALEVEAFRAAHGSGRIFCLVADGDPGALSGETSCYPPPVLVVAGDTATDLARMPLAADARPGHGGERLAFLRIAAALLDVPLDALLQRDARRRQRRVAALVAASLMVAGTTSVLAIRAQLAEQRAVAMRGEADALITFMLGDLRERLEPIGRTDLLDAVGDRAMAYFNRVADAPDTLAGVTQRALATRQIGEVRVQQGRYADGAAAFREARALFRRAAALGDDSDQRMLEEARTDFWLADAYFRKEDFSAAEEQILVYRDLMVELVERQPENTEFLRELAAAEANLGGLAFRRGHLAEAEARYGAARRRNAAILAATPDDPAVRSGTATVLSWLGTIRHHAGDLDSARRLHEEAIAVRRALLADTGDWRERRLLANALAVLADDHIAAGAPERALAALGEAQPLSAALVAHDPASDTFAYTHARVLAASAAAHLATCRRGAALDAHRAATALLEHAQRSGAGSGTRWQRLQAELTMQQARTALLSGDQATARAAAAAAHDAWAALAPPGAADPRESSGMAAARQLLDATEGKEPIVQCGS